MYILFEKSIYILALEMASPGNRHRANCIGTLSFPVRFRAMGSGGGICAAPLPCFARAYSIALQIRFAIFDALQFMHVSSM